MKRDNPAKHFVLAFIIALAVYIVAYRGIEHRRTRNGPWEVVFTNNPAGTPAVIINQSRLSLHDVVIAFPNEQPTVTLTNALGFRNPRPVPFDVPFGKCVFMDTTFLPGTLTFDLFGHEIELLPRVMIIDHAEHPWRSGEEIVLKAGAEKAEPK